MKTASIAKKIALSLFAVAASQSGAETFRNSYISFTLPNSWSCTRQNTEWICSPANKAQSREAIIIVSAKEAGPEDNFSAYQNHLSKPRLLKTPRGTPKPSKVVHSKPRVIHDQQWIEGLHLGSEVDGFFTLYLATVKQGLAVLVSLSATEEKAKHFNKDFATLVKSIRLTASQELLSAINSKNPQAGQEPIGIPGENGLGQPVALDESNASFTSWLSWGLIGVLLIVVLFLGYTTLFPKKDRRQSSRRK